MATHENHLRFVHITDTHINPDPEYIKPYAQYTPLLGFRALVEAVNNLPFEPDFILHTGDVGYDPVPEAYEAVKAELSAFKAPVYYVAGNHDDAQALQRVIMERADTEVTPYLNYEFEAGGVQIVCVDSNGPHVPEHPSGTVPPEGLAWLEQICTADDPRPLVVAVHHNPLPIAVPWLDEWMRMENGEEFHAVVQKARRRLRGVFFGHIHQNVDVFQDGVLYSAGASSWVQFFAYPIPENTEIIPDTVTPPGFSVVSIAGAQTFIRRYTFAVDF